MMEQARPVTRWVRRSVPVTTYGKPENILLPVGSRIVGWERGDNPTLSVLLTVIEPSRAPSGGELAQERRTLVYIFTDGCRGEIQGMEMEGTPEQWLLLRPLPGKISGMLFEMKPPGGKDEKWLATPGGSFPLPPPPSSANEERLERMDRVLQAHASSLDELEDLTARLGDPPLKRVLELEERLEELYAICSSEEPPKGIRTIWSYARELEKLIKAAETRADILDRNNTYLHNRVDELARAVVQLKKKRSKKKQVPQ